MRTYILRRILLMIPTLLGAVTLIFLIMRLLPGDVALYILGSDESSREPTGRWRGLYAIAALGGEPEKAGRPWFEANDQIFVRAKGSQSGPCRAH